MGDALTQARRSGAHRGAFEDLSARRSIRKCLVAFWPQESENLFFSKRRSVFEDPCRAGSSCLLTRFRFAISSKFTAEAQRSQRTEAGGHAAPCLTFCSPS